MADRLQGRAANVCGACQTSDLGHEVSLVVLMLADQAPLLARSIATSPSLQAARRLCAAGIFASTLRIRRSALKRKGLDRALYHQPCGAVAPFGTKAARPRLHSLVIDGEACIDVGEGLCVRRSRLASWAIRVEGAAGCMIEPGERSRLGDIWPTLSVSGRGTCARASWMMSYHSKTSRVGRKHVGDVFRAVFEGL